MVPRLLGARPAHARGRAAAPPTPVLIVEDLPTGLVPEPGTTAEVPDSQGGRRRGLRRRHLWSVLPPLVAGALALILSLELTAAPPPPVTRFVLARSLDVRAPAAAIPWPAAGQAAVAVPALGLVVPSDREKPAPIASLTKMMTAFVVLKDHPVALGAQGPEIVITAAQEVEAGADAADNDSSVPVQSGELLTERQLLDGLLVHSADNFADVLAEWDAGNVASFVQKMNSTAASFSMRETHYADASGLDPGSVSTPADQLRLAIQAMKLPTFAAVVDQPTVTLPIAGTLTNYVHVVGSDGIVGVKSGFTQAAMGCLVLAAVRDVEGRPVEVMAAVTGQPGFDPLDAASAATVPLLDATAESLRVVHAAHAGERVAEVRTQWSSNEIGGVSSSELDVLAWPGEKVRRQLRPARVRPGAGTGTLVGTLVVVSGSERIESRVLSTGAVEAPSLVWLLERF